MNFTQDQITKKPALPLVAPRAHSVRDACKALNISVATGYRLAAAGKLKITKIGSRSVISEEEITRVAREGA